MLAAEYRVREKTAVNTNLDNGHTHRHTHNTTHSYTNSLKVLTVAAEIFVTIYLKLTFFNRESESTEMESKCSRNKGPPSAHKLG